MSGTRFVAPNLAALGALPLVDSSFETLEAARTEFFVEALRQRGIAYDSENLLTDPHRITFSEAGASVEALFDKRINASIRSLSLATATGSALDHIAATYYGISRQQTTDGQGNVVFEADDRFRARIQLAPEAFSTAGPEGAYLFHALELDGQQDIAHVAVLSHEDGATYSSGMHADAYSRGRRPAPFDGRANGDPVLPAEVIVVALPSVAYGAADQSLLDRVYDALSARDVRPLADTIRVEPAVVIDYTIDMELTYSRGADPAPLIAAAKAEVELYAAARRFVGGVAQRLAIGGAGNQSNSEFVDLTSPAADVGGGAKEAPNLTSINVTAVQIDD